MPQSQKMLVSDIQAVETTKKKFSTKKRQFLNTLLNLISFIQPGLAKRSLQMLTDRYRKAKLADLLTLIKECWVFFEQFVGSVLCTLQKSKGTLFRKETNGFMLTVTDQCFISPAARRGRSCHPEYCTVCVFL